MAQLLLDNVTPTLVSALHDLASKHGVSAEEEHRRILQDALKDAIEQEPSFIEFLMTSEPFWPDDFIPERNRTVNPTRRLELQ